MKKIFSIILIFIISSLLIGCGGSSSSDEDTGSCSITVKINGSYEKDIIVNLGTDFSGVTNSNGTARIYNITPGTYNITLIRNDITIETGETIDIEKEKHSSKMLILNI